MYLSRLTLNPSRLALLWISNPYRVHQRLRMAADDDPHLLFRIEKNLQDVYQILLQSQQEPDWKKAFDDFAVLSQPPECKPFAPCLENGSAYRFRLMANPTIKRAVEKDGKTKKTRLGLLTEQAQIKWLERKVGLAGSKLTAIRAIPCGLQRSRKNPAKDEALQTHLAVLFDGIVLVEDADMLLKALEAGIGSGKGYGFGLLSLAPL